MELKSITELLQQQLKMPSHIVSLSAAVDNLLGGGLSLGSITQIAGESGIGKTQLCFQLCLDVQIPICLGGVDGEAVFIDTENTFQTQRLQGMAEALINHCKRISESQAKSSGKVKEMSSQNFLSGVYLFRCMEVVQLLAVSHQMNDFIIAHPKVKLIVVDSIAHCIRPEEDMKARMKFLYSLAENFKKLVTLHNIAVVIVNQVTTKFHSINGESRVVPALGATWSYVPSTKLMLLRRNNDRVAFLYKSPTQPPGIAKFCVTSDGFRDIGSGCNKSETALLQETTPAFVFSQTTAADLLANEFEPTPENKASSTNVPEEDISEKWLILSQRQLSVSHLDKNISPEDEMVETDNDTATIKTISMQQPSLPMHDSKSTVACFEKTPISLAAANDVNTYTSSQTDVFQSSTSERMVGDQEPSSPILISRTARKRRRLR